MKRAKGIPIYRPFPAGTINTIPGYPIAFIAPEDTLYNYTYLIARSDSIIARQDVVDLTGFPTGNYQICGLSYSISDSLNLPILDGSITRDSFLNDIEGPNPSLCAEMTNNCIDVTINSDSPLTSLVANICQGDTYMVGDSAFNQTGNYQVDFLNENGCDSLVNLALTVIPPSFDTISATICQGDSVALGGLFYNTNRILLKTPFKQ